MAKIRSGILGNTRGKVAGVVASQWKDVNYLREYTKPANPRTDAQIVQRTKMSDAVSFCKPLVGPIFNNFTDKFQKSMSGFNAFISQNIILFTPTVDLLAVEVTTGKLLPLPAFAVSGEVTQDDLPLSWEYENLPAPDPADKVSFCLYNKTKDRWFIDVDAVELSVNAYAIDSPLVIAADELYVYAFYSHVTTNVLRDISTSASVLGVTP